MEVTGFSHLDDEMGVRREVLHRLLSLLRYIRVTVLKQGDQERDAVIGVSNLLCKFFFLRQFHQDCNGVRLCLPSEKLLLNVANCSCFYDFFLRIAKTTQPSISVD